MVSFAFLAVYLLYKGVGEFIHSKQRPGVLLMNVACITSLLLSLIMAARIPRLTNHGIWNLVGWIFFLASAVLYWGAVSDETKRALGSWVGLATYLPISEECKADILTPDPAAVCNIVGLMGSPLGQGALLTATTDHVTPKVVDVNVATAGFLSLALLVLIATFVLTRFKKLHCQWGGNRLFIICISIAIVFVVGNMIAHNYGNPHAPLGPVWPLVLASAAFTYLLWLSTLIFDLAFVWHRYIRHSVVEKRLLELNREKAKKTAGCRRPSHKGKPWGRYSEPHRHQVKETATAKLVLTTEAQRTQRICGELRR